MKKEDYIEKLHKDELFGSVIAQAADPQEARFIKAFSEEFLISVMEVLGPLAEMQEKDPDNFKKQLEELDKELIKIQKEAK